MLSFEPALARPDLLASSVNATLARWSSAPWIGDVCVAEIEPEFAGGLDLCSHYGLDPRQAGNCLLVHGKRAGVTRSAGCLVPPGTRTDLGGLVRKFLDARQVSLMPKDQAMAETGMEYGSITVVGLPEDWPVLVDETLADAKCLVVGAGVLRAKLRLPVEALLAITKAHVVPGLAHYGQ
jgi:prolyl-tRNA editing enzyme YbaK/EbsC (Cys-tRNA(Pro) deacylase)